jgi:DNA-binding protein Alba
MQLTESGEITIKARGRAISAAVDVAEVVSKRFLSCHKRLRFGREML